jgi:hypothetical protein
MRRQGPRRTARQLPFVSAFLPLSPHPGQSVTHKLRARPDAENLPCGLVVAKMRPRAAAVVAGPAHCLACSMHWGEG